MPIPADHGSSPCKFVDVLWQLNEIHSTEIAEFKLKVAHLQGQLNAPCESSLLARPPLQPSFIHKLQTLELQKAFADDFGIGSTLPDKGPSSIQGVLSGAEAAPNDRCQRMRATVSATSVVVSQGIDSTLPDKGPSSIQGVLSGAEAAPNDLCQKMSPTGSATSAVALQSSVVRSSMAGNSLRLSTKTSQSLLKLQELSEHALAMSLSSKRHKPFESSEQGWRRKYMHTKWFLRRVVKSSWFEFGFSALIMVNACFMAVGVQYDGIQVGYELEYRGMSRSASDAWPHCETVLSAGDWFFGIVFIGEVALKLSATFRHFWQNAWNILDFSVVVLFVAEKASASATEFFGSQIVRMFRISKLVRLARLVRTLESFDALFLMSTALRGSMSILWWAFVLLFLMQFTLGILVSQILHSTYFKDTSKPVEERQIIFEYFGTLTRSLLSMFEITMANWPPICRLLSEHVSEWAMVFCVAHKLSFGFAVIGIINGVFIQETFKIASADDDIMVRQKRKQAQAHRKRMEILFGMLDTSQDGKVDREEFEIIGRSPVVKEWLASMELETDDLPMVFSFIDHNQNGFITIDELVKATARLKGTARSIDVIRIIHQRDGGTKCI